jgi:hypothetical protein
MKEFNKLFNIYQYDSGEFVVFRNSSFTVNSVCFYHYSVNSKGMFYLRLAKNGLHEIYDSEAEAPTASKGGRL